MERCCSQCEAETGNEGPERLCKAVFLYKVEKLFPQLVGDYRIQTLKCLRPFGEVGRLPCLFQSCGRSSSRPTMSALWSLVSSPVDAPSRLQFSCSCSVRQNLARTSFVAPVAALVHGVWLQEGRAALRGCGMLMLANSL